MDTKKTWTILPLILALFIDNLSFGTVYPLIASIFKNHPGIFFPENFDPQQIDFFLSLGYLLFPLGMFFGASYLGDYSDVKGRKKTLIICMLGLALGFFMMSFATVVGSLVLFLVGRLITGLMAGAQPIAQASIVDVSTEENKALNMSFITLAVITGVAFGPMIGGFFADKDLFKSFGYYLPLLLIGLLALVVAIWLGISFKHPERPVIHKRLTLWRPITVFIEAMKDPSVRRLSWIFFIFQTGFGTYFQFMLLKLQKEFSYSVFEMGMFTGFLGVNFMIALTLFMRHLVKLCRVETLCLVTFFLTGLTILISAYTHSHVGVWILASILGMIDIIAYTSVLTSFSNAVDRNKQGWALGVATSAMALAWLVSGLFANFIPEVGVDNVIGGGGLLAIISSLFMFNYIKFRKLSYK